MMTTTNKLPKLLPAVRKLSRGEKLRLIQILADDLARDEQPAQLHPGATYPVWSPHDAFEAARTLQQLLDAEKTDE